ncbi:MAG: cytochrome c peroxidase [Pseudomonas sp.]|uniref:cytochrome-c peroxidase n=1 Tax=Pseudomonas sp. TaxID=306 RepID=UPI003BB72B8B
MNQPSRGSWWLLALNLLLGSAQAETAPAPIELASTCPPGFELSGDNSCALHSLYDQYNSMYNQGVGGLKTALPARRDGFSPQQIDLGRQLFFDPLLSGDQTLSCASCHHPKLGFADGQAKSTGIQGRSASRGAPSLWNMAFLTSFFWDARAKSLEEQMTGPLYSPNEMGNTPAQLLGSINANSTYQRLFTAAYPGEPAQPISLAQIYGAIAAFETSLISLNSRYDHYAHGYAEALNANELEGMNVFRSFVARCAECHTPPLFTNQQIAVIGVPEAPGQPFDTGAESQSHNPSWRGGFKVPSLRNIALTAPYMHNGAFANLRDASEFYTKGRGHALPEEEKARVILHWHIWEPKLADLELERLVDFMQSLTDESFTPAIPSQVPSGLTPGGRLPAALQSSTAKADPTPARLVSQGE